MPRKRIPLVGSILHRSLSVSSDIDQQFINCFPEVNKNSITGDATAYLYMRPGTAGTNCAGASYVGTCGSAVWSGFSTGPKGAFGYLNGTTLQIFDSARAQIGGNPPIGGHTGFTNHVRLSETVLTGTANLVLLCKDSADGYIYGWYYAEGGAWTEITDGDFPPNQSIKLTIVGNAVHMDGYMFVMDSRGQIWNSDLNSISSWTSTSFTTAQVYADGGRGLARVKDTILAFGSQSVEFFRNSGNATGSPLTRIPNSTVKIGALASAAYNGETIKTIGDNVYWVGIDGDSGKIGFYKSDGQSVKKISTPAIDRYLQYTQLNGITAPIAGAMPLHGMTHIVLGVVVTASIRIPVYCVETNTWWYMSVAGNSLQSQSNIVSCLGLNGEGYFVTNSNGNSQGRKLFVTTQSTLAYTDDDTSSYEMSVITMPLDMGEDKLKEFKEISLIADTQGGGEVNVSYSDNDYSSFISAKKFYLTSQQKRIRSGLGWGRQRVWKLSKTDAWPFRGRFIELEWETAEQ